MVRHMPSINDPLQFAKLFWPSVRFYREQKDMVNSIRDSRETLVVAGNQLGALPPVT